MPTLKRAVITRPYQQALLAALAIAVLRGLALVGLELRLEFDRARASRAEVKRSHVTRAQLLQIFSSMQDAETGQGGYVIMGQASPSSDQARGDGRAAV